jgi:hypothetical protein
LKCLMTRAAASASALKLNSVLKAVLMPTPLNEPPMTVNPPIKEGISLLIRKAIARLVSGAVEIIPSYFLYLLALLEIKSNADSS